MAAGQATVYVRYSRLHNGKAAFFGLRLSDVRRLEGVDGFVAFLWDTQPEPLFLPWREFADVFRHSEPAADGQFKVQVYPGSGEPELYVARAGRYNVAPYLGWAQLEDVIEGSRPEVPDLAHAQVQTLLGAIGSAQGLDIWIPPPDRANLDWSLASRFECRREPPVPQGPQALETIDVVWVRRGASEIEALYEVEHSTPIYSGLLRFNDVRLTVPGSYRFTIVSDDERREQYARQLYRPTFRASGLSDHCQFMSNAEVFLWHRRVAPYPHDGVG